MKKHEILNQLTESTVVAVIRGESAEEAVQLTKAAVDGGIRAIELTYTTPQVQKVFEELHNADALLGAGTVLDPETARHAILYGAKFVVSPHFNAEVATVCNRYGIPYLPGCMTIREMVLALEAGCDILKLFPANNFSPSFIKSVKGPLPHVQIMPTGGINAGNMKEWIDAGAVAVGVGSDLNKAYKTGGYDAVVEASKKYIEASTN
ncbi:bifunctional 2-keto-4-hydroxyglutarate aldolase/2-keto-3-deoxy-6-phosphogluconate aldolase [Psychrobacillus lasiicapitis]|uniref:Bifunctional 4-hydroxy-2-oxoglutarate aldolase/2-dehydro-3-deoxy-phosphogluconate aldolase n=1 Tax=Psychrobacillus lasiicapitis TaxID=1636719 RepID=A0A544TA33_9BACI|nr:bifunctional 2-keto-4-hydroxyglutarate aldolase/2-keto-3-deoxy-6-phosphogluconate aldolase [Psychrobacillus lasiicapitis]TQR14315.1 bifunctional 4-hydroxy-2-oxoglutarate aldolase/2-dehydro-3-deoxy-phosphogluconate aldolase [Psychrobacillus lasiicapitis]GGA32353.1 bifunctional 2-keto-4-hydroxyglutarate aldolase/2-keto-3-deoxy-6-phosphogluconate aldolase [Psychrobacillus lasiicapitis]